MSCLLKDFDPRATARWLTDLLCTGGTIDEGCWISAVWIYENFENKQPFGLWAHRHIKWLDMDADYVKAGKDYLLSRRAALLVCQGQGGKLGAHMKLIVIEAVKAHVFRPGNEHLLTMEGLMADAHREWDEEQRLKRALG